ncbi:Uncharacterized protein FWK35_00025316 [Aphis craccivora]|uniref:Nucleic-acid-binding protein n=1 Tax=Aphis craccivora TaxID=307492 RepID=A0A6G0Y5Q3_APHCR|nr:Uncharacterized protein FWK35_00025316 [Aphis craccivora]
MSKSNPTVSPITIVKNKIVSKTINQGQQNTTNVAPKTILSPPIFTKGVHDYIGLRDHLKEVTSPDSFMCKSTATHLKIQVDTPNSYINIIHYLKETNAQYHTYQPQSEKPLRLSETSIPLYLRLTSHRQYKKLATL